jgi:hypothetical protein
VASGHGKTALDQPFTKRLVAAEPGKCLGSRGRVSRPNQ